VANSMKLLAWLCLATGALAWPLAAEEITVTIPPDPPAAAQAEAQQQPPPAAPSAESVPVAQDTTPAAAAPASPPEQPVAAPASQPEPSQAPASPPTQAAAPAEAAPVTSEAPKAKVKDAAETPKATPAEKKAETVKKKKTPSHAANSAPGKSKTKKAAASCKGLTEDACGTNSACIWVVGTPAEGEAKATKARCRSFAVLKKEAKKRHQAAKTKEPEVLPWATKSSAGSTTGTAAKSAVATSPSAVKQQ